MSSKITGPLLVGILVTVGFNLSPIVFGYGLSLNIVFLSYALVVFALSFGDRRVLGYATVLTACNPASTQAKLSFSLVLAFVTVFREFPTVQRRLRELGRERWWSLFLAAFVLIVVSVPFWPVGAGVMMNQVKQALSHIGYLCVLSLSVYLTMRNLEDGVRVVSLLCLMSAMLFLVFYLWGEAGMSVISAVVGSESIGVEQYIGSISLNFVRTQVCVPLAVIAAASFGHVVGVGLERRAVPAYVVLGVSVTLLTLLASVGSAFAMACGMAVVIVGFVRGRQTARGVLLGLIVFALSGAALYWVVYGTETMLSARIVVKGAEYDASGIDRQVFWAEGIDAIRKAPLGEGWSFRTGHSDWLVFLLSYGWLTGVLYIAAAGALWSSMWSALRRSGGAVRREAATLLLVGLAALSVYIVNAVLDMPAANVGYYQIVWALILTPAAVTAASASRARSSSRDPGRSA